MEDNVDPPGMSKEQLGGSKPDPEPRLMISKIVCENFKSYAGVKELGPFHKVSRRVRLGLGVDMVWFRVRNGYRSQFITLTL